MRDNAMPMKLLREPDGSYTAIWTEANGVQFTIESPSWRKLVNQLHRLGFREGIPFEDEIPDGIGVLERAMR